MHALDPKAIAAAYGGEVRGDRVFVPTPGHSSRDRGTVIKLLPSAPDGCVVHHFNASYADALAFKNDMRARGLLPPLKATTSRRREVQWKVTETYEYDDGEGNALYRTKRLEDASWQPSDSGKPNKSFRAERYDAGRWLDSLGDTPRVPYRLTELKAAIEKGETVCFVEGERKADKLIGMGIPATAIAFGANGWRDDYAAHFRGATVCILPDNDDKGRDFVKTVFAALEGCGAWAFVLELPDLPPKGDIVDWTGDEALFRDLMRQAFHSPEPAWLKDETQPEGSIPDGIVASPFRWPDPASLPVRRWLYGRWLLRGELTTIVAPGGVGKTALTNVIALSLASGKDLLNLGLYEGATGAWIYNIEDGLTELERQVVGGAMLHDVQPSDCGDRLYLNSGMDQPLCVAREERGDLLIVEPVMDRLKEQIQARKVSTLIVDPFVSSHSVDENANSLIDKVAKRWKRLAHETDIAIVLVHHTRKSGGREIGAEDSRGAKALIDASRITLVLNRMTTEEAETFSITDPQERQSLFRVDSGKSSRSPPGAAIWVKLQSQSLNNGKNGGPSDEIGVATIWQKPDAFDGLSVRHLYELQQRIITGNFRESVQANDWIGHVVADVVGLDAEADKGRIKSLLRGWKDSGAIKVESRADGKGNQRPFVAVGKAISADEIQAVPHLKK